MWLILGIAAIVFAILNVVWSFQNKQSKWLRFISLSFTALTVCAFYADGAARVVNEDWAGLMDIMPTMSKALWVCVILSILVNSVSLYRENNCLKKVTVKEVTDLQGGMIEIHPSKK